MLESVRGGNGISVLVREIVIAVFSGKIDPVITRVSPKLNFLGPLIPRLVRNGQAIVSFKKLFDKDGQDAQDKTIQTLPFSGFLS